MKYDYWIKVQELILPLGENRYAAIAEIHKIGTGKVQHALGEVWGRTREEAESKMKENVQDWLGNNP